MITGIILAAGAARRMGQLKQLLPLAGKPMVWHVANAACQSSLNSVILVSGAGADSVDSAIQNLPVTVVRNDHWENGQSKSVTTGLKKLSTDTDAVLFLLADQPLVTTALIDALINAYHHSGKSIICPCYAGHRGNPVLFGWAEWKNALNTLSGDQGARQIIAAHPESVHYVAVESGEILWDVDTEEDYRRVCEAFRQYRKPTENS